MTKSPTSSASEVAEFEHREIPAALQPKHGEISARVAQHDLGVKFAPIGKRDFHLGHVFDHMVIGDDETRRVDDDT